VRLGSKESGEVYQKERQLRIRALCMVPLLDLSLASGRIMQCHPCLLDFKRGTNQDLTTRSHSILY
jgi:hypothetical protein